MKHRPHPAVRRSQVLRALFASGAEVRFKGGEVIIDLGSRHFILGGRRGLGPVAVARLTRTMERAGYPAAEFCEALYGRIKGQ